MIFDMKNLALILCLFAAIAANGQEKWNRFNQRDLPIEDLSDWKYFGNDSLSQANPGEVEQALRVNRIAYINLLWDKFQRTSTYDDLAADLVPYGMVPEKEDFKRIFEYGYLEMFYFDSGENLLPLVALRPGVGKDVKILKDSDVDLRPRKTKGKEPILRMLISRYYADYYGITVAETDGGPLEHPALSAECLNALDWNDGTGVIAEAKVVEKTEEVVEEVSDTTKTKTMAAPDDGIELTAAQADEWALPMQKTEMSSSQAAVYNNYCCGNNWNSWNQPFWNVASVGWGWNPWIGQQPWVQQAVVHTYRPIIERLPPGEPVTQEVIQDVVNNITIILECPECCHDVADNDPPEEDPEPVDPNPGSTGNPGDEVDPGNPDGSGVDPQGDGISTEKPEELLADAGGKSAAEGGKSVLSFSKKVSLEEMKKIQPEELLADNSGNSGHSTNASSSPGKGSNGFTQANQEIVRHNNNLANPSLFGQNPSSFGNKNPGGSAPIISAEAYYGNVNSTAPVIQGQIVHRNPGTGGGKADAPMMLISGGGGFVDQPVRTPAPTYIPAAAAGGGTIIRTPTGGGKTGATQVNTSSIPVSRDNTGAPNTGARR